MHILRNIPDDAAWERSRWKQANAKRLFDARLKSRNLDWYRSLMNDVPIQSING